MLRRAIGCVQSLRRECVQSSIKMQAFSTYPKARLVASHFSSFPSEKDRNDSSFNHCSIILVYMQHLHLSQRCSFGGLPMASLRSPAHSCPIVSGLNKEI